MPPIRRGVIAALWTPTHPSGRLLTRPLVQHLNFLRRSGVDGVLALGSTGEFPRFNLEERKTILRTVVEQAGTLPVLANITSIRLDEVATLGKLARSLGVRGVAIMPPPFFPLSQADMLEFFLRAADEVRLPFYLYNFPELAGNRIDIETIAAFADRARLAGVKQSGGEFTYHKALIALGKEKDYSVFSGADTRLTEVFALGASGAVGGLVNFVPDLMVDIYRKSETAGVSADRMREVGRLIGRLTFPLNVAAGIAARGLEPGAPKTVVSASSQRLYTHLTADLAKKFRQWKLPPA